MRLLVLPLCTSPLVDSDRLLSEPGVSADKIRVDNGPGSEGERSIIYHEGAGSWGLYPPGIRDVVLKASKIHADDTPVPVLDPGRGKTATARIWAYAVDDRGSGATTPPLVWYDFTIDRTGAHPQRQLASFTGYLQADGCAGYDKLFDTNRVTEVDS